MLEKYLQEIGLSEKEALVYLALLQVDNESIQEIAKRTDINRTTVYPVLESLAKKGLVSEVQVGKKVNYEAAPPERLVTFVERQKVILVERSERLKDIIPQIKSIQREQGERPVVKFFDGRDGVVSAYEEFYDSLSGKERDGYMIFNRDLIRETYSEKERDVFSQIRMNKKVKPNSIYNNKDGEYREFESEGTRTWIDVEKYPITADITIIDDKVILSSLGERVSSFLIKSKDIALTLSSLVKYINEGPLTSHT